MSDLTDLKRSMTDGAAGAEKITAAEKVPTLTLDPLTEEVRFPEEEKRAADTTGP